MKTRMLVAGLLLPLLSAPAWAEPASPLPQVFAQNAAISNQFEIAEAQVALQQSSNPEVLRFARQMIHDHGMAQRELAMAGSPSGVVTAFMFDAGHQTMLDALSSKSGSEFDTQYMSDQRDSHADAEALLSDYAASGEDPALRQFAAKTLPVVLMHQRMLQPTM